MNVDAIRSCGIGGDYYYDYNGNAVYQPPCTATPTHRYRSSSVVDGHWAYRCAQHARWLDRNAVTVEPLPNPAGDAS